MTCDSDDCYEVPLWEAFAKLMEEEYCDVLLEGTDGGQVPANRMALSVRSSYFHTMFKKGSFREANHDVIPIGLFSSNVLRGIVEYIHTDDTSMLSEAGAAANDKDPSIQCVHDFQALVSLTEAATYVGLPGLCKKAQQCLSSYLNAFPSLGISILAATKEGGAVISTDLINQAWFCCMRTTGTGSDAWNEVVLGGIHSSVFESVLRDENMKLDDSVLFALIHAWSRSEPTATSGGTQEARKHIAKELVQNHAKLEFIDPDILSESVAPSGLVTTEQLLDAFQTQAKNAKHEYNIRFQRPSLLKKGPLEWKNAKSSRLSSDNAWITDSLEGWPPCMLGQRYQWTLQFDSAPPAYVWLGIVKSTKTLYSCWHGGNQVGCWGIYGSAGVEWSNGAQGRNLGRSATFAPKSRVTMTLDLSDSSAGNGTLSVAVDCKPTIVAISNMRDQLQEEGSGRKGVGFLPAVSCMFGSATIVDLQML